MIGFDESYRERVEGGEGERVFNLFFFFFSGRKNN